jgi:hypothetical protein
LYQAQGKTTTFPEINVLLCKIIIPSLQRAVVTCDDAIFSRPGERFEIVSLPRSVSSKSRPVKQKAATVLCTTILCRLLAQDSKTGPNDLEIWLGIILVLLRDMEGPGVKAGKLYDLILCILNHTECNHWEDKSYIVVACLVLNDRAHLFFPQGDSTLHGGIVQFIACCRLFS